MDLQTSTMRTFQDVSLYASYKVWVCKQVTGQVRELQAEEALDIAMRSELSSQSVKCEGSAYLDSKMVAAWLHQVSDIKF